MTDNLGADAVLDFVNASSTVEPDTKFLRRRARLVLVVWWRIEIRFSFVSSSVLG